MQQVLFTAAGSTDAQITSGDVGVSLVPVGESRNYTCETSEQPTWRVTRTNGPPIVAITYQDTRNGGVFVPAVLMAQNGTFYSTLMIEGTLGNNNSVIECGVIPDSGLRFSENHTGITVVVFSKFNS